MSEWSNLVCVLLIAVLPTTLFAQDLGRAMLHNNGETLLNGQPAPSSAAIFYHDWVQTRGGSAQIEMQGTTVTILPNTIVQFEGEELDLDRGILQMNTSRAMKVRVHCIMITPISPDTTRYDVSAEDGKASVAAHTSDVTIHSRSPAVRNAKTASDSDLVVHAGQNTTREEHCGAAATPVDEVHATGAFLNAQLAKILGSAAVVGLACFGLCREDNPMSPTTP